METVPLFPFDYAELVRWPPLFYRWGPLLYRFGTASGRLRTGPVALGGGC